jgi:hypothetical protein
MQYLDGDLLDQSTLQIQVRQGLRAERSLTETAELAVASVTE